MPDRTGQLEKLLERCAVAATLRDRCKLLYTDDAPDRIGSHNSPRFNVLMSGSIHLRCITDGQIQNVELTAPAVYYCTQNGYQIRDDSAPDTTREALSICYWPDFLRVVHLDYDGTHTPPLEHHIYHHTRTLLSGGTYQLLHAAETLYREGRCDLASRLLWQVFDLSVADIAAGDTGPVPRSRTQALWGEIHAFLAAHREEKFSRTAIARMFQVSPGHVSRLAKYYTGGDFCSVQLKIRLAHAVQLLLASRLTVAEIADRCGFRNPGYFFRCFRAYYHESPREYRQNPAHRKADTP